MSYRLAARHNLQDLSHRLIDFNKSLSEKPEEAHFLWGERIVTWDYLNDQCPKGPGPQAKNYFSLENLASRILKISHNPDGLSLQERAAGIQIVGKTLSLYQHTDAKLPFKSLITRILVAIREGTWLSFLLPIVDQTRLQLEITAKDNFASFEELDFRKKFHVPADMRLEDHPAFSGRVGQTRIIAKTDALLAKVEESKQLINTLLQGEDLQDDYIKDLTSGNAFAQDPTRLMIFGMIHRGVHMAMEHDSTRARIIGRIPDFIEQATSIEYLRDLARSYFVVNLCGMFQPHPDQLKVFEKSLTNESFLEQLDKAKKHYAEGEFYYADEALRAAYQIFPCADNFEEYHVPELILESAAIRQ